MTLHCRIIQLTRNILHHEQDAYRFDGSYNYKPYVDSFTVCSFFLLNVKTTVAKGCFFAPRECLEDIEFAFRCKDEGLLTIKSQKFFVYKPSNKSTSGAQNLSGMTLRHVAFERCHDICSSDAFFAPIQSRTESLPSLPEDWTQSIEDYINSSQSNSHVVYWLPNEVQNKNPLMLKNASRITHFSFYSFTKMMEDTSNKSIMCFWVGDRVALIFFMTGLID